MKVAVAVAGILLLTAVASATVYFEEKFDDSWEDRWQKSTWKLAEGTAGEWKHTAGDWYGDAEADKGIQTTPDARFFTRWAEFKPFSNKGKDLVLQFSVKHEQKLDCGGGYIKLLPASADDMKGFGGNTPYSIMFGPDICGFSTKKVHVILTYKGKNHLTTKDIPCETDQLTHVYTLVISPDNTYKVLVDLEEKASGSLYDDFDMLAPRKIKDPEAKKPEEWDERAKIHDPEDKKPEGWDDIPKQLPDTDATKPDDWDDEEDGVWEPPMIANPEYKGPWMPKMIDNPAFKGLWVAPDIDNPDFSDDPELYLFPDTQFVGFELWQVKSGSLFDNIIVTDSLDTAKEFAEATWGRSKDAEKVMFEEVDAERRKQEEEERTKREEELKAAGDAEEDDEGDDEYDDEEDDDIKEVSSSDDIAKDEL